MLITLVRHAEVQEAYHKCYNGHINISLSKKGREESKNLAEHFKDQIFDAIFCSDLKRCKETLEHFNLNLSPVYTQALREKSWGRHEGKSFDEIIKMEAFTYENFEQWIYALDGEEYPVYVSRIESFFKGFLPASSSGNVLVMTHAGVIRVLMHLLQNISLQEAFSKPFNYANYIILDTDNWEFKDLKCV